MAMELYVLSDSRPVSFDAWQEAIYANGFPLRLSADRPFGKLGGVLPGLLSGRTTAFECDHWNMADLIADFPELHVGHCWTHALAFRWGSNVYDGIAAYMAAGAYAALTGGVVFDCVEGKIISPERAGEIATEIERQIPLIEEAMQRVKERAGR